jgi:hypothetical protein
LNHCFHWRFTYTDSTKPDLKIGSTDRIYKGIQMKKFMAASALSMIALALVFTTGTAEAKGKKMSKKAATKECKAETPDIAGAALKECVSNKRK